MHTAAGKPARFPTVGLGAGSLANAGGEAAFVETVRAAWNAGVRYFDTSALYLGGESERRLGAALQDFPRDELYLSTKLGRYQNHTGSSIDPQSKASFFDYSAGATRRSVEKSMTVLKVDRLDAVYIHDLGPRFMGSAYGDLFKIARDETYPELMRMKADGLIGSVGVASMEWQACFEFAQSASLDVVMPAGEYSLLRTKSQPLLDYCCQHGIAWFAASPFNSGILATGAVANGFYDMRPATPAVLQQVSSLETICRRHSVPLAAAAIQFPLRHPAVNSVVFGAKSPEEFKETNALLSLKLPDPFWEEISTFVTRTSDWEAAA